MPCLPAAAFFTPYDCARECHAFYAYMLAAMLIFSLVTPMLPLLPPSLITLLMCYRFERHDAVRRDIFDFHDSPLSSPPTPIVAMLLRRRRRQLPPPLL